MFSTYIFEKIKQVSHASSSNRRIVSGPRKVTGEASAAKVFFSFFCRCSYFIYIGFLLLRKTTTEPLRKSSPLLRVRAAYMSSQRERNRHAASRQGDVATRRSSGRNTRVHYRQARTHARTHTRSHSIHNAVATLRRRRWRWVAQRFSHSLNGRHGCRPAERAGGRAALAAEAGRPERGRAAAASTVVRAAGRRRTEHRSGA